MEKCGNSKARIVFLDDDTHFLDLTKRMLQHMRDEWDMLFFSSPESALQAIDDLQDSVVVADWMMPGMDGICFQKEAKRRIREKGLSCGCFIVLTGKQEPEDVAQALDSGFDDFIPKPFHLGELIARIRVGIRVLNSERQLRMSNEQLQVLATTDPLTGLYNRRHGNRIFKEEMAKVIRSKQEISVIMADIDHFKHINDTFGHDAGDRILAQFAKVIRFTVRNYDVPVRWGGEEFLIICPHTDSSVVGFVTDRLIGSIRNMEVDLANKEKIRLTASFGTSSTDVLRSDNTPDLVADPIVKADEMLYLAKSEGRDRVFHFGRHEKS